MIDATTSEIRFGPFTLDLTGGRLLRGETPIELRRKAWEVLCHLAQHAGAVVTNTELFDRAWPGTAVTPQALTNVIHELRVALDDPASGSQWIQTVHGRGHVFLPRGAVLPLGHARIVVARRAERARLRELWERALAGERQVAFVVGEPGIGKTTLVEAFAGELQSDGDSHWHATGCSIEHEGRHEAYQPFLSAMSRFASGARQREVAAALRQHAPTWLFQIPRLMRPDERRRLEPALVATTSSRMLREGVELFSVLASARPLLVILEDLHWADQETLDLVAALARDPVPLRLLLVATMRPADPAMDEYRVVALARSLGRERRASEVAVTSFDLAAVAAYVEARLGSTLAAHPVTKLLAEQCAGNPLFLRALIDDLVERGALDRTEAGWALAPDGHRHLDELPASLRNLVQSALLALPNELRTLLELASVVGDDAMVHELAAASDLSLERVEEACERLAGRGRLLQRTEDAPWIDGTSAPRYAFPHPSHRRIVYEHLAPLYKQALHRRFAAGLEVAYAGRESSIAPRLAAHFERAGDVDRAVLYLERAATNAERAFAYREAADYLTAALGKCDDGTTPQRPRAIEIAELNWRLGSFLVLANGYSTPAVERAYIRAHELATAAGDGRGRFISDLGLGAYHLTRARYGEARDATDRLLELSRTEMEPLAGVALCWAALVSSGTGELGRARAELERGLAVPALPNVPRGFDVHRMIESQLALVLAVSGAFGASRTYVSAALARSDASGIAPDVAHARMLAAEHAVFVRDRRGGARAASIAAQAAAHNDFKSYLALCRCYEAALHTDWPASRRLDVMSGEISKRHRLGDRWHEGMLHALMAEISLEAGDADGARTSLDLAREHIEQTGERYYEAEVWRLSGVQALVAREPEARALECLERAVSVAETQGALLLKLRAETDIARLALERGSDETAAERLARALEAVDTESVEADVEDAGNVLRELHRRHA